MELEGNIYIFLVFLLLLSFIGLSALCCICRVVRTNKPNKKTKYLNSKNIKINHCQKCWRRKDFRLDNLIYKSPVGKDVWRAYFINSFQMVNIQLVPGSEFVVVHDWTVNLVSSRLYKPGETVFLV